MRKLLFHASFQGSQVVERGKHVGRKNVPHIRSGTKIQVGKLCANKYVYKYAWVHRFDSASGTLMKRNVPLAGRFGKLDVSGLRHDGDMFWECHPSVFVNVIFWL